MTLTRRSFAFLCLAWALPVPAWAAEKLSVDQISEYLNSLVSVKGAFTQINADGTRSTGTLYLKRPGRVRFEYNPPETGLVMAGAGRVAIFDGKSNQPPEQYPLRRTPLHLILKRSVDLQQEALIVGHTFDGTATSISLQDRQRPGRDTISLVFSGPPIELRQWVITGSDGTQTTVVLGDLDREAKLGSSLFNITLETRRRK